MNALLLIYYSPLIPLILWPYFSTDPSHELYLMGPRNVMALLWQFFLVLYAFVVIAFVGYVSFFGCLGLLPPHGIAAVVVGAIIVAIAWYLTTRPICIIQRCFLYTTDDTRQLYATAQRELRDPNNLRVVLIAHSQGALIASLVVDRLVASETTANLKKLELYTFGSAADHMHGQGDLSCIEHFVNRCDYFARSGILSYQPAVLAGNRYDGQIYIDEGGVGHLLNMHYLSSTFVKGGAAATSHMATYLGGNGRLLKGGAGGGGDGGGGGA
ncbi:hypothetical protein BGX29_002446 [Mortierella sp. GBA35]|nr:hypothetical protein BGX29_002446 [Mortierella sp. GBA35]